MGLEGNKLKSGGKEMISCFYQSSWVTRVVRQVIPVFFAQGDNASQYFYCLFYCFKLFALLFV